MALHGMIMAVDYKRSFSGKFSLGRYRDNNNYKCMNWVKLSRIETFRIGFEVFCYNSDVLKFCGLGHWKWAWSDHLYR